MKPNTTFVITLLAGLTLALHAEDAPTTQALSPEQKVVVDQANAYTAAYNKGDIKALGAQFAEDAEWVDEDGNVLSGRAAIEAALKAGITGSPGRKVDLSVESVRVITPDVLLEKGTSVLVDKDGRANDGSYTAVHVKKGDAWFITQLTETGAPDNGDASEKLADLAWMVGDWVDNSAGVEVKTKCAWTANHTFLTRSYTATRDGGGYSEGTEVIGWDPTISKVRSWSFDSDGGFSENIWAQDGNRWLIQVKAVAPDGRKATAQHTVTYKSDDKFTWSSANRNLDGELLPNIEAVEIIRAK